MGICCSTDSYDQFDPPAPTRVYASKKHGHYIGTYPWGFRSSVLKYIKLAEKEKEC